MDVSVGPDIKHSMPFEKLSSSLIFFPPYFYFEVISWQGCKPILVSRKNSTWKDLLKGATIRVCMCVCACTLTCIHNASHIVCQPLVQV